MFISIEGNIGSGKTTLAKALAKQLKATYLPEQFEENALLPLFYNDRKTFAFPTEYSFLIDRHKQLQTYFQTKKKQQVTVSDFHFDKCICFAKANLSSKDYLYFKKHFKALQASIKQPNLVVYINTEVPLLVKNIKKRGRTIEKTIATDYLSALKKSLDNYYIVKDKSKTPVLVLTIDTYTDKTLQICCTKIIETLKRQKL
jgi:deoxyadenosine/deoxycytidine kinase